ncbi:hypothetical protein HQ590_10280 [bacterium]|nr:hypothetical protein [bacterium]
MPSARLATELTVRGPDVPGFLSQVLSRVAGAGVNVRAYCSYPARGEIVAMMVTDRPDQAQEALSQAGFQCQPSQVILVGAMERVGAVAEVGRRLDQAGIQILYSYASATAAPEFLGVFKTGNNEAAIRALQAP